MDISNKANIFLLIFDGLLILFQNIILDDHYLFQILKAYLSKVDTLTVNFFPFL